MENIKVRFNMQIMRRGKIIPVGQPFEVPESELELLKQQGAVVVVEHQPSHATPSGNVEQPPAETEPLADTEPPVVDEKPEADEAPADEEPEKKTSGKVSLAEAAKPAKKSK